jgi:hypothetical protein
VNTGRLDIPPSRWNRLETPVSVCERENPVSFAKR